ncbi:gem-associated protein 8-like [Dendronephthya gigantea]|uniref:gem-associated protein 8-like n=1 Tax=Dendronephthya gigantea TaxID=151771 RepID=UPI0010692DDE|nr:gem-associated protein 8-like [Dendronephthya gigantea]
MSSYVDCECCTNNHSNNYYPTSENHFQNMWYSWWLNSQNGTHGGTNQSENNGETWCITCIEEQRLREERLNRLTKKQTDATNANVTNSILPSINSQMINARCDRVGYVDDRRSQDTCGILQYESENEEEFEMELNNEFKKFLEQSARHREQRNKQKEADLAKAQKDDYIEVNEIALEATTVAPTQQQGALRSEEMKILYGRSAYDIESLETSLQLHFNMNVDMRHPVFWPSIPLKF